MGKSAIDSVLTSPVHVILAKFSLESFRVRGRAPPRLTRVITAVRPPRGAAPGGVSA